MTHNTRDYGDPQEPARRSLEGIADAIEPAAQEADLRVKAATLSEIRKAAG